MFDVPYRSICISKVVPVARADANGTTLASCPLCGDENSLQILEGGGNCHCSTCLAADDIIGIYARARQLTISDALDEMFEEDIIATDPESFEYYLGQREDYDILENIIDIGMARIKSKDWPTAYNLLKNYGINIEMGYGVDSIASRVGVIHPTDLARLVSYHPEFDKASGWMHQSACLIVPIYEHRVRASGVMILNRHGQHMVARLGYDPKVRMRQGTIFTRHVKRLDEVCVVATEAMSAWSLVMKLCRVSEPNTPVVGVWSNDYNIRKLKDLGNRTYVFWSRTIAEAYSWTDLHTTSQVSVEAWTTEFNAMSGQNMLARVVDRGLERNAAMALHLAALPEEDAADLVASMQSHLADLNAIIAAANPAQRARVRGLIVGSQGSDSVHYKGKDIRITADGWEDSEGVVSDAILHLERILSVDGKPQVIGTIEFQGNTYEFHEALSTVRKGGNWLESFLLSHGAPLPYIAKKWRTHIFEIAMQFHRPLTVSAEQQMGWDPETELLTLPNFRIDEVGIRPVDYLNTDVTASGAGLGIPLQLQEGELGESLGDETFWYIFIFMLSYLLQGRMGCELPSLVLYGDGAASWTGAMHQALRLRRDTTANPAGVLAHERNSVLPILVEPTGDLSFVDWVSKPDHKAVVRLSGSVVPLMQHNGWLVREVKTPPPEYVARLLPQIFWLVAYSIPFLEALVNDSVKKGPFWVVGDCVASWVIRQPDGVAKVIEDARAALYRDHGYGKMRRDKSVRLLSLIRSLADGGYIHYEEDEEQRYVKVKWDEVAAEFSKFRLQKPTYLSARKMLSPYLYDAPCANNELLITHMEWVLHSSISL